MRFDRTRDAINGWNTDIKGTYVNTFDKSLVAKHNTSPVVNKSYINNNLLSNKPQIKDVKIDKNICKFNIANVSYDMVNNLRRILKTQIPSIAVDSVVIELNTSYLNDEMLMQRLALIPFKGPAYKLNLCSDISNTFDQHEMFEFRLDITANNTPLSVMSGDLKWNPFAEQQAHYGNNIIKPVHDDITIVELQVGQTIKLNCYTTKGTGEMHSKWSPVVNVIYEQQADASFNFSFELLPHHLPIKTLNYALQHLTNL